MLSLNNIECERGERIIFSGLSLTITAGSLLHIAGKNGTGKTTLLKIIAGSSNLFTGKLTFHDNVRPSSVFIGHQPGIKMALSPMNNLKWWQTLYGRYYKKQCEATLCELDLKDQLEVLCSHLSAGQRQRVALAKLWLTNAQLWLLDEPFSALDVYITDLLVDKILSHLQQEGGTVIMTTHHVPDKLKEVMQEVYLDNNEAV